jgi:serine/threonine protein kinase
MQRNVIKLDKVVNWDPSACPLSWHPDECRAVGLIMSPSATIRAPELLSSWKSFPDPAAFLRASVYQLASGLAYIHSLDILHRDIKPENIIYQSTSPAHATIVDFGASDPSPTSVRHGRGTITYLAPEVMRIKDGTSDQPFSFPSDIWSLGVTLVDFLWGEQYHSELGRSSVYRNFQMIMDQNTRVQPYPQYCKLVQELLAWNPESRLSATVLAKRFPEQEAEYGQNRSQQDGRRRRNSSDGGSSAKCERLQDSHERRITLSTL